MNKCVATDGHEGGSPVPRRPAGQPVPFRSSPAPRKKYDKQERNL